MPPINTNADRDFSADYRPEEEELRSLLKHGQVADMYSDAAQRRMGDLIGRAVFNRTKQYS